MTEPISPQRLAEIQEADRTSNGLLRQRNPGSAIAHRRELIREVKRQSRELSKIDEILREAGYEYPLGARGVHDMAIHLDVYRNPTAWGEPDLKGDNARLTARVAELEGELAQREDDVPARITAELERDEARTMLRYCYTRWPAPIFWQAAAQIDNPYTALPEWLTGESQPAAAPDRTDASPA